MRMLLIIVLIVVVISVVVSLSNRRPKVSGRRLQYARLAAADEGLNADYIGLPMGSALVIDAQNRKLYIGDEHGGQVLDVDDIQAVDTEWDQTDVVLARRQECRLVINTRSFEQPAITLNFGCHGSAAREAYHRLRAAADLQPAAVG